MMYLAELVGISLSALLSCAKNKPRKFLCLRFGCGCARIRNVGPAVALDVICTKRNSTPPRQKLRPWSSLLDCLHVMSSTSAPSVSSRDSHAETTTKLPRAQSNEWFVHLPLFFFFFLSVTSQLTNYFLGFNCVYYSNIISKLDKTTKNKK